jgi:REP element-mobilizing transposase RayT
MPYSNLRKGRYSEPSREYLVTTVTYQRDPWFKDFHSALLLVKEMQRLDREGIAAWLAWVTMPDHMHALLSLTGVAALGETMNKLKGRSARAINSRFGRQGAFWQANFHDHALRAEEDRLAYRALYRGQPRARGSGRAPG